MRLTRVQLDEFVTDSRWGQDPEVGEQQGQVGRRGVVDQRVDLAQILLLG